MSKSYAFLHPALGVNKGKINTTLLQNKALIKEDMVSFWRTDLQILYVIDMIIKFILFRILHNFLWLR